MHLQVGLDAEKTKLGIQVDASGMTACTAKRTHCFLPAGLFRLNEVASDGGGRGRWPMTDAGRLAGCDIILEADVDSANSGSLRHYGGYVGFSDWRKALGMQANRGGWDAVEGERLSAQKVDPRAAMIGQQLPNLRCRAQNGYRAEPVRCSTWIA